MHLFTI